LNDDAKRIVRTYLTLTGLFNGALALIWGVNTLFLLKRRHGHLPRHAGERGVQLRRVRVRGADRRVADTLGRRVSLLFCLITLLGSTLAYVALPAFHLGFWSFVLVSLALGLGFTFWSGAAEAWLVDALKHVGYTGPIEGVFAKSQGRVRRRDADRHDAGGPARQLDLRVPYVVRAVLLVPLIVIAWTQIKEPELQRRALSARHPAGGDEDGVRGRRAPRPPPPVVWR
jgi:hypothetical protein